MLVGLEQLREDLHDLSPAADLHLHSVYSDGTFTPDQLAAIGRELGFVALALTDHDTVEGCSEMAQACNALGLQFIPGVELTTEFNNREIHVLGYFIDPTHTDLNDLLLTCQLARRERVKRIVHKLHQINVPLKGELVFEIAQCNSPGRPHIARALVRSGFASNYEEAFEKYLKKGRPAWVPKLKVGTAEAIELVHAAGGLAFLAHPGISNVEDCLDTLIRMGFDGIECFHSKHSPEQSERYTQVAISRGLLISGGSDCHGYNKDKPLIGGVRLPMRYVNAIVDRHAGKPR